LLVEYLVRRYAAKAGKKISGVSRRTLELLTGYEWPGNIRELQNVIQRAVILAEHELVVDESWLPKRPTRAPGDAGILGRRTVTEETELIETALADSHGRVAGPDGAAAKLGIPRSTLESKIRALQIDKNRFRTE
jgi:formate hydrogenlyase transcriptional activator